MKKSDKYAEIWVPIRCEDIDEGYLISNHGRVKSKNGSIKSIHRNATGYNTVNLTSNKKCKRKRVGRLVAMHFLPDWDHLLEVDHLGLKHDDRAWMLQMVTRNENELRKRRRYNKKRGVRLMRKVWEARICVNRELIVLGYFENKEDAYEVYRQKYLELYKQEPWYINAEEQGGE